MVLLNSPVRRVASNSDISFYFKTEISKVFTSKSRIYIFSFNSIFMKKIDVWTLWMVSLLNCICVINQYMIYDFL